MRLDATPRCCFARVAPARPAAACGGERPTAQQRLGLGRKRRRTSPSWPASSPRPTCPSSASTSRRRRASSKEQALDVDIRHAQNGEHLQLLLAGEVQFTTANGAQVLARNDQGLPLVSIALIGQRSEQGFAVGANSGINSVKDWAGKTFGYKGTVPAEFLAIARRTTSTRRR